VGSGAAGISAALTLKANGKTFEIFGTENLSEKIEKAELIRNYPGLSLISGKDFVSALQAQLSALEIEIKKEKVSTMYALNGKFGVATNEGGYYESRTVILACGVESVKPIEGESAFLGRGVSYCATCDGFLYKGKTIAVVCTSKRLEHEIKLLAGFAEKVYVIPLYQNVELESENIIPLKNMPKKIEGEKRVERMIFTKPIDGASNELNVDGVFMLRETVFPSTLLNGLKMNDGHIEITRNTQTNIAGCFAAGDCTGRPYQYAKAVGEGNVAAHAVTEYLKNEK
jgi:thioredoxin reductase (NADPH)